VLGKHYPLVAEGAIGRVTTCTFDSSEGNLHYVEGQSIGIIPRRRSTPTAKPNNCGSIQIASTRHGELPGRQDGSLWSASLQYEKDGETIYGVLAPASSANIEPGSK